MRGFNSELFFGHIFSGPDSAAPAFLDAPLGGMGVNPSIGQGASFKKIRRNEPITVDFAGAFDGYLVDQTRTLCIGGLPDKLCQAYEDMVKIQRRLYCSREKSSTMESLSTIAGALNNGAFFPTSDICYRYNELILSIYKFNAVSGLMHLILIIFQETGIIFSVGKRPPLKFRSGSHLFRLLIFFNMEYIVTESVITKLFIRGTCTLNVTYSQKL